MIEKLDYSKYLSVDNGKGILLNQNDVFVLERYGIDYYKCSSINSLIFEITNYIDDNEISDLDDLEDVLDHLVEMHYYNEVKK